MPSGRIRRASVEDRRVVALLRRKRRASGDLLGLVLDLEGDLTELVGVLLAVVRAEEKLEPAGHDDSHVRLCPATIAAVRRVQGCGIPDDTGAHDGLTFVGRSSSILSLRCGTEIQIHTSSEQRLWVRLFRYDISAACLFCNDSGEEGVRSL